MTEPYDENHTNVDHIVSNDFHHAFIVAGENTSIQPVVEKIPNNNSLINWSAEDADGGGCGGGGDGNCDSSNDADGGNNYLEIGALPPKSNIATTIRNNSTIELPSAIQPTISHVPPFHSTEFHQELSSKVNEIDNDNNSSYIMSFNETHQKSLPIEEPVIITTSLMDLSSDKILDPHQNSPVDISSTVCSNNWNSTATETTQLVKEPVEIVDDQTINITDTTLPVSTPLESTPPESTSSQEPPPSESTTPTKSVHFEETIECENIPSPKLNDVETTAAAENYINRVECSEVVHREVKILKGRKRIGKLLIDDEDDDDEDDDIDETLEAERQRLLEMSTTPPTSPQPLSSQQTPNSLEITTKQSYLHHLTENQNNADDDDPMYTEEALSILRKKEKPGPKSKKPSTALLKEMQARALIRNAIVIPAITDQDHETNKHKRKNRILDSDDDDDYHDNDNNDDGDDDDQFGLTNVDTLDDIGMLTGCESSTDGNLANGVDILINENDDCDGEDLNMHEGINIEQIEKVIPIENPIIVESDDQEINNKSNDECPTKTAVDNDDDDAESDVVMVVKKEEKEHKERKIKVETLEKKREIIKVKGVTELMNVDCIKLEKNESKMITNQLKNDVVSRDSGNSTDSGYNHQQHRQQQQQTDTIEQKHKVETNNDGGDNDNVINADNDDDDESEPIIPIVEFLKDTSSSTTEDEFIPNDIYFGTPDKVPVSSQYRGRGRPRGRPPVHTSLSRGHGKKSNRGSGRGYNKRDRFIDNQSPSSSGSSSSESSSNSGSSSSSSSSDSDSEENRRRRRKKKLQQQNKRASTSRSGYKQKTTKVIYYQPDTMNRPPFRTNHHSFPSSSSSASASFHHTSNHLPKKNDRFYDKSRNIPNDVYFGDVNVPLHILHSYGGSSDDSDAGATKKRLISSTTSHVASGRGGGGSMSYSYATRGRGRGGSSYMPLPPPAPRPMPKVYHISAPLSVKRVRASSSISPNGDSLIKRMKKCLRAAGLKKIKFNKLWEGCKSNQQRANKIVELLHEKGLEGEPTIAKCRQLRIEIQAKKEIEDLDPNLILTTEGRTTRSSIRRNYKEDDNNELDHNNQLQSGNLNQQQHQTTHPQQNDLPQEPEVMIKLKKVIDSDSDFD